MYVLVEIIIKYIILFDERKNNIFKFKCLLKYFDIYIMELFVLWFMIIFSILSLNLKRNEFDFFVKIWILIKFRGEGEILWIF